MKWVLIGVGTSFMLLVVAVVGINMFGDDRSGQEDRQGLHHELRRRQERKVHHDGGRQDHGPVGGKAKAPAWVPDYPASDPQGAFSAQGEDAAGGTFTFKTKDSSDKVVKYYQDQFKASGLNVTTNITNQNGQSTAGMLGAQDEAKKHSV